MPLLMKMLSSRRFGFPGDRMLVVAVLLSYLALTGEAIHCQYFDHDHDHAAHHQSSEQNNGHQSHCRMACHCAATAIQTTTITHASPLQVAELLFPTNPPPAGFTLIVSSSPRAPPSVNPTV